MEKIIKNIDNIMHIISKNFITILFFMIVIGMFFINSVYLYSDSPGFETNTIWNYLGFLINAIFIAFIFKLYNFVKEKINKKIHIFLIAFLFLYIISELLLIKLIPIKPYSDMFYVTEIASSNFTREMHYIKTLPNNIPTVIIFYIMFNLIANDVLVIKIFNIIWNIITVFFTFKIYNNIYKKENELVLILGMLFIPAFLYINNTYNDILFTCLVTIVLYFLTKDNYKLTDIIALCILLFLQFIIRPVGIILVIASCMYLILKKYNYKLFTIILISFIILNLLYIPLKNYILSKAPNEIKEFPIWSYIQMGINEKEIGFQDGSHSTEWKFKDVQDRIRDLGFIRLLKLLGRKQYWLWTEGTYQVERYAFGDGQAERYYYETLLTKNVQDVENSNFRKTVDYLIKGQYYIFILLSLISVIVKDEDNSTSKKDLLYYFIIGIYCFYLIWEIKSRYIICLYPIFIILSVSGIEKISKIIEK